ncbi:MAG: ABC transporter permease subunit, partial [Candidatus Latescibacterota bacterium]
MLRVIVRKELLEHLVTLRFALGSALVVALFAVGALAWNARSAEQTARFIAGEQEADAQRERRASSGLFYVAYGADVWCPPSAAGLLSGGYSQGLPNVASTSAFEVGQLQPRADRNPWLFRRDLDWTFTVGLLGSLLALLLAHDAIAGEKERGTLRQTLANRVPRDTLLWGKFLATMLALAAPMLVGATAALLIVGLGSPAGVPSEMVWAAPAVLAGGL